MDLSKAQAAAAHYLWEGELNALEEHLKAHRKGEIDLWSDIAGRIDLPDREARRKCAKRAMYATVFGSGENNIFLEMLRAYQDETGHNTGSFDLFRPVIEHPVLREMLASRNRELQRIEEAGGRHDVDGRWIECNWFRDRNEDTPERNVLAYAAQTVEQFLMEPILNEAEKEEKERRPNFQIVICQADGCTIQIRRRRGRLIERVTSNLKNEVLRKAKRYNVITQLEID